jgi:hypothetical protein
MLEHRWKGPYVIILTVPTRLKVDGIAMWIHHTHASIVDLFAGEDHPDLQVKIIQTSREKENGRLPSKHPSNPLKLKLYQS